MPARTRSRASSIAKRCHCDERSDEATWVRFSLRETALAAQACRSANGVSLVDRRKLPQMRFVAFLRGINVGGHNMVRMADLKTRFEELGFENVTTYIQSGNVLFDSDTKKTAKIEETIEAGLGGLCKAGTRVLVRSGAELAKIVAANPFGGLEEKTKKYVTFLAEPTSDIKPGVTPKGDAEILLTKAREVYWVAHEVAGLRGPANPMIEPTVKVTTTRNWNVVQELARHVG